MGISMCFFNHFVTQSAQSMRRQALQTRFWAGNSMLYGMECCRTGGLCLERDRKRGGRRPVRSGTSGRERKLFARSLALSEMVLWRVLSSLSLAGVRGVQRVLERGLTKQECPPHAPLRCGTEMDTRSCNQEQTDENRALCGEASEFSAHPESSTAHPKHIREFLPSGGGFRRRMHEIRMPARATHTCSRRCGRADGSISS